MKGLTHIEYTISKLSASFFHMKMSFICIWMKTHFYMKDCAPNKTRFEKAGQDNSEMAY